jgi:hypothetical protein
VSGQFRRVEESWFIPGRSEMDEVLDSSPDKDSAITQSSVQTIEKEVLPWTFLTESIPELKDVKT